MRNSLRSLTTRAAGQPNVVLLTPGPHNETYFEQAYLARYLGYTLTEGEDLITRDRQVFLRTVGGLKRTDILLRRVDSDFCAPLALGAGSLMGGDIATAIEEVRAEGLIVISLNMAGSVPDAADLVVTLEDHVIMGGYGSAVL